MLDYVIARKNPLYSKDVILELHGSPLFAIRQKIVSPETTEGTIILLGPLDFEMRSMYHLTILANVSFSMTVIFYEFNELILFVFSWLFKLCAGCVCRTRARFSKHSRT